MVRIPVISAESNACSLASFSASLASSSALDATDKSPAAVPISMAALAASRLMVSVAVPSISFCSERVIRASSICLIPSSNCSNAFSSAFGILKMSSKVFTVTRPDLFTSANCARTCLSNSAKASLALDTKMAACISGVTDGTSADSSVSGISSSVPDPGISVPSGSIAFNASTSFPKACGVGSSSASVIASAKAFL